jgi:hypothetical protein
VAADHLRIGGGSLAADLSRRSHDDATRRDLRPFGDECSGGDDRARADDDAVEQDRADADEAVVLDDATVQQTEGSRSHGSRDERVLSVMTCRQAS